MTLLAQIKLLKSHEAIDGMKNNMQTQVRMLTPPGLSESMMQRKERAEEQNGPTRSEAQREAKAENTQLTAEGTREDLA